MPWSVFLRLARKRVIWPHGSQKKQTKQNQNSHLLVLGSFPHHYTFPHQLSLFHLIDAVTVTDISQESSDYSLNQDYHQSMKVKKQGCDFMYFVDVTFAHTSIFYQEQNQITSSCAFHSPSLFICLSDGLFLLLTVPARPRVLLPSIAYYVILLVYMLFAMWSQA